MPSKIPNVVTMALRCADILRWWLYDMPIFCDGSCMMGRYSILWLYDMPIFCDCGCMINIIITVICDWLTDTLTDWLIDWLTEWRFFSELRVIAWRTNSRYRDYAASSYWVCMWQSVTGCACGVVVPLMYISRRTGAGWGARGED